LRLELEAMMAKGDLPRVAVLGAGPIGLEAALAARQLGYPVRVYEKGRLADAMQRWGHIRLFSPFGMNSTPRGRDAIRSEFPAHEFPGDDECVTGRQHVAAYLEPLAKTRLLRDCLATETIVIGVGRHRLLKTDSPGDAQRAAQPFRLLVREKGKERVDEADIVLDCTGTYGQHRWMGDGGIPAPGEVAAEPQIAYGLDDVLGDRKAHYAGKTTLVVGGGYSAATSVCALAELAREHPETWVVWLARATGTQPIKRVLNDPLKERDRLAVRANTLATRADGNVEFHPGALVQAVEGLGQDKGFRVTALVGKASRTWEVDRIVANVGFQPDTRLYRELQVHECYASQGPMKLAAALLGKSGGDCLQQKSHGPETLRNPEPNFYILGAKSYGRNSHFLLRLGFEQVRDVFALITAKKA
jgi:thioredoxin reductase